MATLAPSMPQTQTVAPDAAAADVLICLPSSSGADHDALLAVVADALRGEHALIASPECGPSPAGTNLACIPYQKPRSELDWTLTAADFAAAAAVSTDAVRAVILIAGGARITARDLRRLIDTVRDDGQDLALPRYALSSGEGLANAGIVYPLTRTLFGVDVRFPLSSDICMSPRMLGRLAGTANRLVAQGQSTALLWPVAEAAGAGYAVREIADTDLQPPHAPDADFNELFSMVTGSLFADVEARAALWQRARPVAPAERSAAKSGDGDPAGADEIRSMIESFRIAMANLQEIWAIVLPPQSRLAMKKLSLLPVEAFDFPPELWARTVYDFALAFHARSLNRNHLLGAMAPIYLAWAASQLRAHAQDEAGADERIDLVAAAFDREKPYFVSRWRWPDRFNP